MGENEDQVFRPPDKFVKASEARQARLRQAQQNRIHESANTSPNLSPSTTRKPVSSVSKATTTSKTPTPKTASQKTPSKAIKARTPSSVRQENSPTTSMRRSPSTSANGSAPTSPFLSGSKTHQEIEKIKRAREERRRTHAHVKELRDEIERDGAVGGSDGLGPYRYLIQHFRQLVIELNKTPPPDYDDNVQHQMLRVCVRKRPLNIRESETKLDIVSFPANASAVQSGAGARVYVHEPRTRLDLTKSIETHRFHFDHVFSEDCPNELVFNMTMPPLIDVLFRPGGRSTFFAYGQTGSGKSFTVFGSKSRHKIEGLFDYLCRAILERLTDFNATSRDGRLCLTIRFFEIYSGRVYDLFNRRAKVNLLEAKDGQAHVLGLKEVVIHDLSDMQQWMEVGERARTTGATEANPLSSRSHAIFQYSLRPELDTTDILGDIHSQFSLIDLAGSERAAEANAPDRQTRIEGGEINKSLLALKECIRALNDPSAKHVPFRQSKLTQILRDSLLSPPGPQKGLLPPINNNSSSQQQEQSSVPDRAVVMCATISPTHDHVEHTLNTLRYADRVRDIRGAAGADGEQILDTLIYNPIEIAAQTAANRPSQDQMPAPSNNKDSQNDLNRDELMQAHLKCMKESLAMSQREEDLLALADDDWNEYVQRLEALMQARIAMYSKILDLVQPHLPTKTK